ncbi:MAG TPA: hypothetical protein PLP88_03050, partial [Bacteroidales bacterium]|nr:hypothetical protein [Bacteroidales bacterium]
VEFEKTIDEKLIKAIPGVIKASKSGNNTWKIISHEGDDIRPLINKFAVDHNLTLLSLHREEQKLEDVFQQLTRDK